MFWCHSNVSQKKPSASFHVLPFMALITAKKNQQRFGFVIFFFIDENQPTKIYAFDCGSRTEDNRRRVWSKETNTFQNCWCESPQNALLVVVDCMHSLKVLKTRPWSMEHDQFLKWSRPRCFPNASSKASRMFVSTSTTLVSFGMVSLSYATVGVFRKWQTQPRSQFFQILQCLGQFGVFRMHFFDLEAECFTATHFFSLSGYIPERMSVCIPV